MTSEADIRGDWTHRHNVLGEKRSEEILMLFAVKLRLGKLPIK